VWLDTAGGIRCEHSLRRCGAFCRNRPRSSAAAATATWNTIGITASIPSATVHWRDRLLGVFHSAYQPTEPALFHEMLPTLAIDFTGFVFVDLGSGKGRTLLMAAEYPFRRIVGVELLPALHRVAQENLRKYTSATQKCFVLEAVCGDACEFEFPAEPTVLYLFNPLPEAGLAAVIENLERSLDAHPRKVFVLYHNPLLERVLARCGWLQKTQGTHQYAVYESA